MNKKFWQNKRVFLSGHTGFKGSWMSLLLAELEAKVYGYSLAPQTQPSLFAAADVQQTMAAHVIGDIRDQEKLKAALDQAKPEIVFHFAAQALVRESYASPLMTFEANAMGTAYLLELLRQQPSVKSIVIITTDKVYENKEWLWGYRENEALGGHDPYSASKACAELIVNSYRLSFFQAKPAQKLGLATARAGNVIGGGDWSKDRLIPDIMRNWQQRVATPIRSPGAVRPWQHVLEPLAGYLCLAEKCWEEPTKFSEAWNFGPAASDSLSVAEICHLAKETFTSGLEISMDEGPKVHEAHHLTLDCAKAGTRLDWHPKLSIREGLDMTFDWYKRYYEGASAKSLTLEQIRQYVQD